MKNTISQTHTAPWPQVDREGHEMHIKQILVLLQIHLTSYENYLRKTREKNETREHKK